MLGELEQLVLLAVLRGGRETYGVPVHAEILRRSGRSVAVASVYKTLDRLSHKGFLSSRVGEPTAERGGRRKTYFAVTASGRRELRASLATLRRMARGLDVGLEPS